MIEIILSILFLLPITTLLAVRILRNKQNNLDILKEITKITPLFGVLISIVGAYLVYTNGPININLIDFMNLGISLRLDTLSLIMFSMISIIAFVVLKFSVNYLDGDPQQGKFISQLALTIGLVQLLVLSGNIFGLFIAWVGTSLALNQLVVFYPERKKARIAARKKFIVARLGDLSLFVGLALIYLEFGTGNLNEIFTSLSEFTTANVSINLELATLLLVLTAGLKSAQIPFHSWLIEVMEAPTPVSALLHAGLLNAGPFLMIRFAYLLDAVTFAPVILFIMGALTAIFGATVFTTQPNIKTGLAYSSVAHMGFSLMVSGLGVYSASLLHLVAHSFYKAHAFLSSGSIIDRVRTNGAANFSRKGNALRIISGLLIAVILYTAIAKLWGISPDTEFQLLIIGGIIFTGIGSLLVNAVDSANYTSSILKIVGMTILILMAFFGLEEFVRIVLGNQIPPINAPSELMVVLSISTLVLFFFLITIQLAAPLMKQGHLRRKIGIHVRNGFYLNILVDRLTRTIHH